MLASRLKIIVVSAVAGLVLGGAVTGWALWQSPTRSAAPVATGGVVSLVLANSTGTELSDIHPEGSHTAHFALTNSSTIALSGVFPGGTLTLSSGGNGSSLGDLRANTTVDIAVCTSGYNYNGGNPSCTTWTSAGTHALSALLDNTPSSTPAISFSDQGATTGVRYVFNYGADMPASVQGATFTGAWNFVAVQREGVRE